MAYIYRQPFHLGVPVFTLQLPSSTTEWVGGGRKQKRQKGVLSNRTAGKTEKTKAMRTYCSFTVEIKNVGEGLADLP